MPVSRCRQPLFDLPHASSCMLRHAGRWKAVPATSPPGGSKAAASLRFMYPNYQLYKDIAPDGDTIQKVNNIKLKVPVLSIVTTGGKSKIPFMAEENDTVVTVSSQTTSDNPEYYFVDLNHFEVLMSEEVTKKIKSFLYEKRGRNWKIVSFANDAMKNLLLPVKSILK